MIVVSPVRSDEHITLRARGSGGFGNIIKSLGTETYPSACLDMLERALGADHWGIVRYRGTRPIACIVTASRKKVPTVEQSINKWLDHCYHADPALQAVIRHRLETTVTKIDVDDIEDPQYRHCYELNRIRERLTYFSMVGSELYQLSIFGQSRRKMLSSLGVNYFAALANLLLDASVKHVSLTRSGSAPSTLMDVDRNERLLLSLPDRLSKRECEVCARAVAGQTIDETAAELKVGRTSIATYRQRAYQKLGITRQNQLIALIERQRTRA